MGQTNGHVKLNFLMKKTTVYLISSERIVDESRAEWYRSTVINCHAMIGSQIDDVIQKDEELNNTKQKKKNEIIFFSCTALPWGVVQTVP